MDNNYIVNENGQPDGANNGGSGLAIGSMVCGIISLVLGCCLWYLSLPLAIVSIVLGIMSIKQQRPGKGMAIAGIVCSAIGLVLAILVLVGAAAILGMGGMESLY